MSGWPDAGMIEAAVESLCWDTGEHLPYDIADALPDALSAALGAAPTVGGWVWCLHQDHEGPTDSTFCINALTLRNPDHACPGPHRTLIVGPKVDHE